MQQKYWFNRSSSNIKIKKTLSTLHKDIDKPPAPEKIRQKQYQHQNKTINDSFRVHACQPAEKLNSLSKELEELHKINKLNHLQMLEDDQVKQVKCLHHNSIIILYCESDNMLLCSNCAFGGSHQHSKHQLCEAKNKLKNIDKNVAECQKLLRSKSSEIRSEKVHWETVKSQVDSIKYKMLDNLQKSHEEFMTNISQVYLKNKQKIVQVFDQTNLKIQQIITSLNRLSKTLKFEHLILWVKQLYIQQVMQKIEIINKNIPHRKICDQLYHSLQQISNHHLKIFREAVNVSKK